MMPLDIKISPVPSTGFSQSIWMALTGPRPHARSRSASPPRFNGDGDNGETTPQPAQLDSRSLPSKLTVWAVPKLGRNGGRWYRVYLTTSEHSLEKLFKQAQVETGENCRVITTIELGRCVSEKEVSLSGV